MDMKLGQIITQLPISPLLVVDYENFNIPKRMAEIKP